MGSNIQTIKDMEVEVCEPANTFQKDMANKAEASLDFTRENLELLGSNKVKLYDSDPDNNLDLFCYITCNSSDSELVKQCRGVVFSGTEIVMKSFSYMEEYNETEKELIESRFTDDLDKYSVYNSYEGTLVRMFYFGDKWYTTTHRKLNAFNSKWASKESFGSLFVKALEYLEDNNSEFKNNLGQQDTVFERFSSVLDKEKQYMFLICNNSENRIVCNPVEHPTVYHVGTFTNGVLSMDENINIPKSEKLQFGSLEDMSSYVRNIDNTKLQGVIVFTPDNKQFKILNSQYLELFNTRGNEPSIKFRYLQVRMNPYQVKNLYSLYPDMANTFNDYENVLYNISRIIYKAYVLRFIQKQYVTLPSEEFLVVRDCHSWHLENRKTNKINHEKVIQILNKQTPTNLNHMIRRYKTDQLNKTKNLPKQQDMRLS